MSDRRMALARLRWPKLVVLVAAVVLAAPSATAGDRTPDLYPLGDSPLAPAIYQKHLRPSPPQAALDELPPAYDARNEGLVTPAKDQGSCGSCWAFASAGALESHLLKEFGAGPEDLSEQQQVSCNTAHSGCGGGNLEAPKYWSSRGPLYEACSPYTSSDESPCEEAACEKLRFRVVNWHTVASTVGGFKSSLITLGPSYWRYDVYDDFYDYWENGGPDDVYVNGAETTRMGGHGVLLIGWDDDRGAYLCKNSWGTGGPNGDGTFWIAYSGHANDLVFQMSNFSVARYESTCTWTGATGTDWAGGGNWRCEEGLLPDGLSARNRVPGEADDVVIPAAPSGGRWPTLSSGEFRVHDVSVETGARLDVSGGTLDVKGDWGGAGGGATMATGGTVVLATYRGSPDQALYAGAESSFHDLQIGDGATRPTIVLGSDLDVNGALTIRPGASLIAGPHTIRLGGDFEDEGDSFVRGTSTMVLDGAGQSLRKSSVDSVLGPEGFEDAFPPPGWGVATLDGDSWLQGPPGGDGGNDARSGEHFAWHNDGEGGQDAWLVSPRFVVPAGGARLSFWERNYWMGYYEPDGAHRVMISSGSCEPGDGAFAPLAEVAAAAPSWAQRELSLDAYAGETVCLAFNYRGNYSAEWAIDDVSVTVPRSDGELLFYNLTIAGPGDPAFGGDLTVANDLSVAAGSSLDVGGRGVAVAGEVVNHGSLRQTLDVGAGEAVPFLQIGDGSGGLAYRGLQLTDTSGAGLGLTTVSIMGNQLCPDPLPGSDPILRCYEVTPELQNEATLRLFYRPGELNGNSAEGLLVHHRVTGAWSTEEGAYEREFDGGAFDFVQVTGVAGYSLFTASDEQAWPFIYYMPVVAW